MKNVQYFCLNARGQVSLSRQALCYHESSMNAQCTMRAQKIMCVMVETGHSAEISPDVMRFLFQELLIAKNNKIEDQIALSYLSKF